MRKRKNLLKFGPKTVFFRQKTLFLVKKFQAACRYGGGVPPLAVFFFAVIFWPAACRYGGRGGGVPPLRHKAAIGVFEPFP